MSAKQQRVLVAEDEAAIAEVLEYNLSQAGLRVDLETRGDHVLERIAENTPDVLVLDLMLPGLHGLDILRQIRRDTATLALPVLVLTAKGEEVDRIVGLELGADDYVTKPFSPREVVLRVKALLRRSGPETPRERLAVGGLTLDVGEHRFLLSGEEVPLTATEFRLLHLLMERAGRVQTRENLLSEVWGYAGDVNSRTVDTHIRRLRGKLAGEAEKIETVIGVGYRFRA